MLAGEHGPGHLVKIVLRRRLGTKEEKKWEVGEACINKRCVFCAPRQILLRWWNQKGRVGAGGDVAATGEKCVQIFSDDVRIVTRSRCCPFAHHWLEIYSVAFVFLNHRTSWPSGRHSCSINTMFAFWDSTLCNRGLLRRFGKTAYSPFRLGDSVSDGSNWE